MKSLYFPRLLVLGCLWMWNLGPWCGLQAQEVQLSAYNHMRDSLIKVELDLRQQLAKSGQEHSQQIEDLRRDHDRKVRALRDSAKTLKNVRRSFAKMQQDHQKEMTQSTKDQDALRKQLEGLRTTGVENLEEMTRLNRQIKELNDSLKHSQSRINELQRQMDDDSKRFQGLITRKAEESDSLEARIAQLEGAKQSQDKKLQKTEEELSQLREKLERAEEAVQDLKALGQQLFESYISDVEGLIKEDRYFIQNPSREQNFRKRYDMIIQLNFMKDADKERLEKVQSTYGRYTEVVEAVAQAREVLRQPYISGAEEGLFPQNINLPENQYFRQVKADLVDQILKYKEFYYRTWKYVDLYFNDFDENIFRYIDRFVADRQAQFQEAYPSSPFTWAETYVYLTNKLEEFKQQARQAQAQGSWEISSNPLPPLPNDK